MKIFTGQEKGELSHGGGDAQMMEEVYTSFTEGKESLTGLRDSLESHYMAMAAEQSRVKGGSRILMREFRES